MDAPPPNNKIMFIYQTYSEVTHNFLLEMFPSISTGVAWIYGAESPCTFMIVSIDRHQHNILERPKLSTRCYVIFKRQISATCARLMADFGSMLLDLGRDVMGDRDLSIAFSSPDLYMQPQTAIHNSMSHVSSPDKIVFAFCHPTEQGK
jgi:hypothetical protein